MPIQPDNVTDNRPAAAPSGVVPPVASDPAAQQGRMPATNKSSAHYLFRSRRKDEEPSVAPQPSPVTPSSACTTDAPAHHKIDAPIDATTNQPDQQFAGPPEKLQAAVFKDMPAFDIVALARATGKTYTEVLENYLREPLQRRREFILANAPFMKEKEILGCIEQLPPEERPPILMSLSPFIRSHPGKIAFARYVEETRVPPTHEGKPAEYLRSHHEAKQEPVLGALRDVEDPKSIIKQLPTNLRANAKWVMTVRQLEVELRTLHELDHDEQLKLLKKVEACINSEKAEFAGYIDGVLRSLSGQWEPLPLENKVLALRLIGALSSRKKVSTTEPAAQRKVLENLLDELMEAPHSPVVQKDIVRMVKAFCKQDEGHEQNRIALLKKLGDMGSHLHAASTYESRAGFNVQRYAYNLFKNELGRLSRSGQGEVAAHWAKQQAKWNAACRPSPTKHWNSIGYAVNPVIVVGSATQRKTAVASNTPATSSPELNEAKAEAEENSPVRTRPLVLTVYDPRAFSDRPGAVQHQPSSVSRRIAAKSSDAQHESDDHRLRWNLRHHCRQHGCGTHCKFTNRVCIVDVFDGLEDSRCRCTRCSSALANSA